MPLISLQYLRGIAALMVVVVHLSLQLQRMAYQGYWPDWAAAGVDIFFVLSGFLMWFTTAGRQQTPLEFYRRRIARIVPLYWLMTSVVVAVLVLAPRLMQSVRLDWLNVVASYLFVFSPSAAGRMEPVLLVGWTLNYEMLFYLVYGAALALAARWRFAATTAAVVLLVLVDYPVFGRTDVQAVRDASLMLEFVFGMAIAAWWRGRVEADGAPGRPAATSAAPPAPVVAAGGGGRAGVALALLAAGFAALALQEFFLPRLPSAIAGGLPAAAIVCGALLLERSGWLPVWPALRWLGDISFSLYLSHPIALSAFSQAWRRLGLTALPAANLLFCLAATAFCVLVGAAVYRLLEVPLVRRFHGHSGSRVER
ncbi:acyltransferase family protein [Xylophilus sp. Kf1]|nr:acyltransferase family protein [Xylophilus sp. Kf1]